MHFETGDIPRPARRPREGRERRLECANCGSVFSSFTGSVRAFCTPKCRTTAEAVRYGRAKLVEYGELAALPEDVMMALRYKVGHALGAGYDSNARHIPADTRALVWKRDEGRCVTCSKPGEEIDHIDGSSPDPSNLRLLCKDCHHAVTESHMQPITDNETRAYRDDMVVRMHSPQPLVPCDDVAWSTQWRTWVSEHERSATP